MLHYIVQVRGGHEQDPEVFEGLHTFNNVTFKHKLLAWVSRIEHHDFCFFHVHRKAHVQHKTVGVCLTVVVISPLTPTLKGHLQQTIAIRVSLLGPVHRIHCRPSTPHIANLFGLITQKSKHRT